MPKGQENELAPIMTPERILGALIWQVWHGQLDDALLDLVDTIPQDFIRGQEEDLDVLLQMAQGANRDPVVRESLIATLQGEIMSTLRGVQPDDELRPSLFGLDDDE